MKNSKGITLIALVVTIIVLLILAGITIAMLKGDNGIITRTNTSKISQIEGQVKEEIKLAVQSAKIDAMQKSVATSSGYFANKNLSDVVTVLREDLTTLVGYTNITPDENAADSTTAKKVTITYTTSDYTSATNYSNAKIVAEVTVTGNKLELTSIKHYRASTGTEASGVEY